MSLNQRIYFSHDGITDSLTGWSNTLGISRQTLFARYRKYGNDMNKVLISGVKRVGRKSNMEIIPKVDGLKEILEENNIEVTLSAEENERLQKIRNAKNTHQPFEHLNESPIELTDQA